MILPGATLGMLGGGQLGRMFTIAARTMGYEVIVLDPDPASPAGQLATEHLTADYQDKAALDYLAKTCAAVSTEFENVPAATMDVLAKSCVVRPGANAVAVAQDRIREKTFLRETGLATADFAVVESTAGLKSALQRIGGPALLKVSRLGYDGKGQARVENLAQAEQAWESMRREACVLEALVPLDCEISVVIARGSDGVAASFPVGENTHVDGILDLTVVPARIDRALARAAENSAKTIAQKLDYVGVMAVEFFVSRGNLLVNEIAPRPHNSGHYTIDACVTDQFEQQVRTLCGLPLGDTRLLSPVAMVNLLGDLWHDSHPPSWLPLFTQPTVKLHLYGKHVARPKRKMGHYCVLADSADQARVMAESLRGQLLGTKTSKRQEQATR